jgi:hypothetical protein
MLSNCVRVKKKATSLGLTLNRHKEILMEQAESQQYQQAKQTLALPLPRLKAQILRTCFHQTFAPEPIDQLA